MADKSFIIPYPQDGTLKTDLARGDPSPGVLEFDFEEGFVVANKTKEDLSRSLKGTGNQWIRSIAFYTTVRLSASLGENQTIRTFFDVGVWHILENIQIKKITFYIEDQNTPDKNNFQLIASPTRKAPYRPKVSKLHEFKTVAETVILDTYAVIIQRKNAEQYDNHTFVVTATDQDLKYKVSVQQTESGAFPGGFKDIQAETTLAAGDTDFVILEGAYKGLLFQAKNAVGAVVAKITLSYTGNG